MNEYCNTVCNVCLQWINICIRLARVLNLHGTTGKRSKSYEPNRKQTQYKINEQYYLVHIFIWYEHNICLDILNKLPLPIQAHWLLNYFRFVYFWNCFTIFARHTNEIKLQLKHTNLQTESRLAIKSVQSENDGTLYKTVQRLVVALK